MFIAVEGCIGAGKSTVAKGLADHRKSTVLLEAFQTNPFLEAFAKNPGAYALETEFSFLLIHYHQLKEVRRTAGESEVVSDFHLGKDLIYSGMNLHDPRAERLFNDMYTLCANETPQIDLMVCLSASDQLILERIHRRRREFELDLSPDYYLRLNEKYETFFTDYRGSKLMVRMDGSDFVEAPSRFLELSARVDAQLLA